MNVHLKIKTTGSGFEVEGRHRGSLGRPIEPARPGEDRQGIFAEWDWDGRRLEVRNDRYGLYPLFLYQGDEEIILSDSLSKVIELGAPRELDLDALAVFLRLQLFPGDDTPFRHVKQLPPSARLAWTGKRAPVSSRRPVPEAVTLASDEAVGVYAELFRESVRRRLPLDDRQPILLPLSGGQDSRHILLELLAQGRPPSRCVTIARDWSPKLLEDARVAAELARAGGVPHVVLTRDKPLFELETRKNELTNYGTLDHAWFLTLVDFLGESHGLVFDGLGGDILSACILLHENYLALYRQGDFARLADLFLGDETPCREALNPAFYASVGRDRAILRLAAELERHAGAVNPLTEFYFWNRTRRSTGLSPYSILSRYATVESPFLDHDLFDFLIARPPEWLKDPSFHKRTIRATYPRFAGIPFGDDSAPFAGSAAPYVAFARQLSRALLRSPADDLAMLRKRYVIPRLSRGLVDSKYALASAWLPQWVLYLSQLGAIARDGVHSPALA